MSAPTPAPGDDRPREGYYPDPSIPGYVRYWNGAAWVPGTSRPAPSDGEPLPPPPGAGAGAAPAAAAPAEETGPVFFDEAPHAGQSEQGDPETGRFEAAHPESAHPESAQPGAAHTGANQHGSRPEPASAWQADAGRQSGLGGEQERRVSWGGAPGQADPRVPSGVPGDAAPEAAKAPETPKTPEAAEPPHDESNPGTVTIRAVKPGAAKPAAGEGTVTFRRPTGPVRPAAEKPGGQATPAASAGTDGTMAIRAIRPKSAQQGGRTAAGRQPSVPQQGGVPPQAATPPQTQQPQAPQSQGQQQPQPQSPQSPASQPQPSVPQQGGVSSPVTSGPGGGSPSWAQQVHQLAQSPAPGTGGTPAQQGEGQPVVPWKPVAEDPFLAVAQAQAAARPAGLGRRLAARLVDTVVLAAVTGAAALPLGTKAADHIDSKIDAAKLSGEKTTVWLLDGTTAGYFGLILAVLLLFGVVYEALPTAKWGRTLGKKVCGIEVRDIEEHEAPTFGAALRRWLVYSVPGVLVIGVVGVLWCVFDRPWRQCWHDKAANTFVAG
ncbi:RDD family protein [Streptomyces sp. KL118A]|uniref:RDD family protein n=1 Tax=Streptomyces sp. KL118A TaxID=3045153 RepID=UPI00278BD566|nr:RDD family protein [Streptomyces sp. KL118A]